MSVGGASGWAATRTAGGLGAGLRWRLMMPVRMAVMEAPRWQRGILAILLGVIAVGALPPLYVWPLLVPAFCGLIWLIEGARRARAAFTTGWLFGLGYFIAGLYWVANAFMVQAERFGSLAPVAVIGLAALLAMFTGGAALLSRVAGVRGIGGVLVFAASWTTFEWLRSWVLTGFPWNLIGSVWVFSDALIQSTAVFGTYGLGLVTVIVAAMPAVLADARTTSGRAVAAIAAGLVVMALIWAGGATRLAVAGPQPGVPDVRLRLVQPNIPQKLKFRRDLLDEHLAKYLELTAAPAEPAPTHVIWGETAAPLFLSDDPERLARIGAATPDDGLTIVGTMRRSPADAELRIWNSLLAIAPDGAVVGIYDKSHLVPGGEYVPFRDIVSAIGITKVTAGTIDFSAGPGVQTLALPGLPAVSPLICYEVIFPARVTAGSGGSEGAPRWLLNLTNDAWYGNSPGPYQHFAASRLRAVEEGLPLVRVANTGISAIVDPFGRVIRRLDLDRAGFVDGPLPKPLERPTLYAVVGNWSPLTLAALTAALGLFLQYRARSARRSR